MNIGSQSIEFECPECRANVNVLISQVINEEIVTCQSCKKTIQLTDKDGSMKLANYEIEKGIKSLQDEIKKINRSLRF